MRTGKGDICGWLGRLLPTVALLVCLLSWPALAAGVWPSVVVGALGAFRRPRGGGSVLRWCAAVAVDVLVSSVFPYVRPPRRRTLRRVVTLCAALYVSVTERLR
ncbi:MULTISPECIES: hypothetical protein [Streptomyces]|uniref:hypothetical protein n=1 Tax=Streptomyces TaxID=1883 RepID=UPI000CF28FFF|nr:MULTISPECIES: hypothetical protein [Streptomyces]PPS78111.1 hypothetical protein BV882_02395 [Streptomyces sp. 46]